MPEFNFTDDYGGQLFTGKRLRERLQEEGKEELVLQTSSLRRQTFPDKERPDWVLSFGYGEDELRIKSQQQGRPFRDAWGADGSGWIGKFAGLSVAWTTWSPRNNEDPGEGYMVKTRAVDNAYARSTGATHDIVQRTRDLDDAIPF